MWQSHQCTRWTRRSLPKVSKLISQGCWIPIAFNFNRIRCFKAYVLCLHNTQKKAVSEISVTRSQLFKGKEERKPPEPLICTPSATQHPVQEQTEQNKQSWAVINGSDHSLFAVKLCGLSVQMRKKNPAKWRLHWNSHRERVRIWIKILAAQPFNLPFLHMLL